MLTPRAAASLPLHPLVFVPEGDDVTVGRRDVDVYAVLPADGAALLRRLSDGTPLEAAAAWYEQTYGESVDLGDFVESLRELGFLREDLDDTARPADTRPVRWQWLGRLVFSPVGWLAYAALLVVGVLAVVHDPALVPQPSHVFFTPYLTIVELTVMFGSLPLVLLHELGHVLAGRRLGLRTRVRLSQRLHYLVIETVMDGLVAVPRRQRWLPMLAGMLVDVAVMAALTLLAAYDKRDGHLSVIGGAALALCFATIPRIAWQFYFFLRTDIYQLLSTVLGTVDLHGASSAVLRSWWLRLRRGDTTASAPDELDRWHPRDRRAARWYAPLIVVGYSAVVVVTLLVVLPLAATVFGTLLGRLAHGEGSAAERWDAVLVLSFTLINVAVAGFLALRRRQKPRSPHASPPRHRRPRAVRVEPRHARPGPTRAAHRRPSSAAGAVHVGRRHSESPGAELAAGSA